MISSIYSNLNDSPQRKIQGKVSLYNGQTHLDDFLATDKLQEITIARTGEKSKFFGFGVCQQATVKIVDKLGELAFSKGQGLVIRFSANDQNTYEKNCPKFYIRDVQRDEKTNVHTLTAYDALDAATSFVWDDLGITAPYTLTTVVGRITSLLGLSQYSIPDGFTRSFTTAPNLEGNENIRTILNAIAEATQTIYFVDASDRLVFKRLSSGSTVLTIYKKDYFELATALPVTLTKIMSVTELGDNVHAGTDEGACQYVRDNPFWANRTDIATLLNEAVNRVSGLTIVPYTLKWRGLFSTELCDKINIQAKDGSFISTYILDDSYTYNGGFNQTSGWEYSSDSEKLTASNPATIGEKLNQTFARVDKVNKNIELLVSEVDQTKASLSSLTMTTDAINLKVTEHEEKIEAFEELETGQLNQIVDRMAEIEVELDGITSTVSANTESITTLEDTAGALSQKVITNESNITALNQKAGSIEASVSSTKTELREEFNEELGAMEKQVEALSNDVALKMTSEDVTVAINKAMSDGVNSVTTTTGFTFNEQGLTVSKSGREMTTTISENGMTVYKDTTAVLTANNVGVDATNLRANTYLIIGNNSRFENFGSARTACFWIGSTNN